MSVTPHRDTISRYRSISPADSKPKCSTGPAACAARRISACRCQGRSRAASRPRRPRRSGRRTSASAQSGGASTLTRSCAGRLSRSSRERPGCEHPPVSSITIRRQIRSTSSSWWLENRIAAPAGGALGKHFRERLDGLRIEPGERLVEHQQLAAVHERDRELDALLVAVREGDQLVGHRSPSPSRSSQAAPRRRPRGRHAVQPGEVGDLVEQRHLRVQAALLGHVSEPQAIALTDHVAVPLHRAVDRADDPHHRAHRRGLAGAVAADQPDDLAAPTPNATPSSATRSPKR